ncbi:MAG: 3-deoxy-D-manno-octulosonic acid transferase [Acidobacteriota bacterium]
MYLLYSFMLAFWSTLLIPIFRLKAWRRGTDFPGIAQRLGHLPESVRFDGRKTVWLHSCSVGETLSLPPLAKALQESFPEARLLFSTTTPTGQSVARECFDRNGKGNTFYFPIDLTHAVDRVLDWIRPSIVIIVETEIWPNLLRRTHSRNIPVILVNGRISGKSFRYYRWLRPFLRRVLAQYHALMMQSKEDVSRILAMGAPEDKTRTTGNMKFDGDIVERETHASLLLDLESTIGAGTEHSPLIVAGSTHANEEQTLLDVLEDLRKTHGLERTRLLVAPRHPERFESVAQLVARTGFKLKRRTELTDRLTDADVILLDTIGELPTAYHLATVVFVGGTLVNHGGHSILEPALCSKAIVVGPFMDNFQAVLTEFTAHDSIHQTTASWKNRDLQAQQLLKAFRQFLLNPEKRDAMGTAARSVLDRNRGAVRRTVREIESFFNLKYTQNF